MEHALRLRLQNIVVVNGEEENGPVSPDTFRGLMLKSRLIKQLTTLGQRLGKSIREIFGMIDVRGTGTVSHASFGSGLTTLEIYFDERDMGSLIRVLDGDGDGSIDTVEFCNFSSIEESKEAAANLKVRGYIHALIPEFGV